jgi:hypothetical protein
MFSSGINTVLKSICYVGICCLLLSFCIFQLLVGYIEDCLKGGNLIEEVGLHPNTAGERGLKLLVVSMYKHLLL